ncbi:mannose-1-phosphate guanylyltransferase/mannose-6-phosphate isomerase [Thiovibrio frasassiensis]|uniref:mannose-1-phosphate guanylyltransferase n=1 Tax=Thiovibrio frasassiensis TaxID=2984131 RepID=A0A9X4MHZ8_9BACT|nr:mannose-1-phosphate guanylyltransferase/mannose-6-phosphate isomerase [Thiovibrio frasassiensis]MDG4476580.1 mannose-1-phosphate guanylyltransferase/mannose-6-phosphate isomerase [Thiovibrio frasassiensis]
MQKDHPVIIPVILAGGSGTRLWPLSRECHPKQLLPLVNDKTMLQNTLLRVQGLKGVSLPIVVCTEEHRFLVAEQVRAIGCAATIIIEPVGRDTAPAVAVAALEAVGQNEEAIILVLPADHVIDNEMNFAEAVARGVSFASHGQPVTFGIVPQSPHTGYGYIKKGSEISGAEPPVFAVDGFVEKPSLEKAREYLAEGYLWNSGMFLFPAAGFLATLKEFEPTMADCVARAYVARTHDLDFTRLDSLAFSESPANSVDYAVMERVRDTVVVPLDCSWSDVGSWEALWEIGEQDAQGNVFIGNVLAEGVSGCYIHAGDKLVAAIGLSNHIIVETKDALLVAAKDRTQEVKAIVKRLTLEKRDEVRLHKKVFRPWGSYECVDSGDRFQVKRIMVNPGATLSLQRHFHRAEHWVVVKGTAHITNSEQTIILTENQSTYIPLGAKHRLKNPGTIPLEIVEIQTGSYLGEDDIERLEDLYGR